MSMTISNGSCVASEDGGGTEAGPDSGTPTTGRPDSARKNSISKLGAAVTNYESFYLDNIQFRCFPSGQNGCPWDGHASPRAGGSDGYRFGRKR